MFKKLFFNAIALFVDPIEDLTKIKLVLKTFRKDVYSIGEIQDPIIGLVRLCNTISKFEDMSYIKPLIEKFKSADFGQFTSTIETLEKLELSIHSLGRDMSGTNRTMRYQIVTQEEIYLKVLSSGIHSKKLSSLLESKENISTLNNQAYSLVRLTAKDILDSLDFLIKIC